jgi:hypothetical protein
MVLPHIMDANPIMCMHVGFTNWQHWIWNLG